LLDQIQKLAELPRTVAAKGLPEHRTGPHIECGEQRKGAMTFVVMRPPFGLSRTLWQERRGALQCLNLALLIHAQHQLAIRRVQVQAQDVAHLVDEQRVFWRA
jgi:hypothetical protein